MNLTQEQLEEIIESHGKWLRDEEGGKRAYLSGADLRSADLRSADLRSADLSGADLSGAYLSGADLSGAYLRSAYLSGADLRSTYLRSAYLSGAVTDKKYLQISCIGSRRGTTTYCVDDDLILCGCWNDYKGGTLEQFEKRIADVYGPEGEEPNTAYYQEYKAAVEFFKAVKNKEE